MFDEIAKQTGGSVYHVSVSQLEDIVQQVVFVSINS